MATQSDDSPVIVAQTGPLNGQRWSFTDSILIGRDSGCQVVVNDRQVSRFHARISKNDDGILIEDLGSKNGTYINGSVIEKPKYLQDGDLIQVALVQHFVFLSSDSTMPLDQHIQGSHERQGHLFIDIRSRRVWIGEKELVPPLSVPQFRLLQVLYDQQGRVIPRHDLIIAIWGVEEAIGVSEQALDALIRRLRERLEAIDPDHTYLVTVRGHGLRLENPID